MRDHCILSYILTESVKALWRSVFWWVWREKCAVVVRDTLRERKSLRLIFVYLAKRVVGHCTESPSGLTRQSQILTTLGVFVKRGATVQNLQLQL